MPRAPLSLLLIIACVLLPASGWGVGSNNNSPAPGNAPQPEITIESPADGSAVTTLPTTLQVSFAHGADPGAMKALLNGVDITSQFTPGRGTGVAAEPRKRSGEGKPLHAKVDRPAVNLGKNQLQITSGDVRVSSTFIVSLSSAPKMPASEAPLPLLVPMKTRVLTGPGTSPTDYNIALYKDPNNPTTPTLIQSPQLSDGSNTGFQFVYLQRTDLSVVENDAIPNPDLEGDGHTINHWPLLLKLFEPAPSGCGSGGCLVIIQSLGNIGYAPCGLAHQADCFMMSYVFQQLGGSGRVAWANGDSDVIAYSFIGNTSSTAVPAGAYFESLTCKSDNYGGGATPCDFLGYPNTSFTAPQNATPDQIGNISGVLIRDNYRNFTFAQNAPPVSFSTSTELQTLTHTISVNGVAHVSASLQGAPGGFHLLILNRKTLEVEQEETFPSSQDASEVNDWYSAITGYKSYGYLFIFCALGDTTYTGNTQNRSTWFNGSQLNSSIGGTQQVFYLLNEPENNPVNQDDYTLVRFFVDQPGRVIGVATGLENQVGAEQSSVIARETQAVPLPSDMEGLLRMDHQGFYSPRGWGHNNGFANVALAEALTASLQDPTPWPFPGPDQAKSQAAYTWISQQLCCDDIRSAYLNLNVSPTIWLVQLQGLSFNQAALPNSDQADFDAMKQQLAIEFEYVTLVRQFQSNILGLHQDQQANVSLLLQEALDEVIANLKIDLNTPAHSASWVSIVADLFSVGEALAGFSQNYGPGIGTALAVGSLIIDQMADATNTPAGSSLRAEENADTTAGNMANKAADEFSRSLVSVGNQFDRLVSDWGRLKTLGAPLAANQLPWDSTASGILLQSYDTCVSREYYTQLLQANTVVQIVPYTNDHLPVGNTYTTDANDICDWETFVQNNPQLLYYPNGSVNDDKNDTHATDGVNEYPYDYQWGMWTLIFAQYQNESCPGNKHPFPSTFGLFDPLDPNNPEALGTYRLWFYTRENFPIVNNNQNVPCVDGGC